MTKQILITLFIITFNFSYSQKLLVSWSQQNIENYTREMYDEVQKLTSAELLAKNLDDKSWSAVFLTLNASLNNYVKDKDYLKSLANQLTNKTETKLEGTSRLIIWDRIISKDIVFEGKGLVMDNDLFTVSGRANQILQSLTKKNFGYVTVNSTEKELKNLKKNWLNYLSNKNVEEFKPLEYKNSKIPEISSLNAVNALIISLQANPAKEAITKKCLKNVYKLDEMPKEKGSSASHCNPDTYTYTYLAMLFGDEKTDESKNGSWWSNFWNENHKKLVWNSEKGIYQIK
ncbi:hypothetical protein [Flavobacterium gelatinilyticum]|uniref:hypothetical protein n=1 Tax=Flavobacterium gelatinilyticum TaxID=3003260 RepID=UPI00248087F1|nr:hypothetical protein [Flavobacterium gelatinilyticum]